MTLIIQFVVMIKSVNIELMIEWSEHLDAVPWKERQWGHWMARNAINTKRKLGLGTGKKKTLKF